MFTYVQFIWWYGHRRLYWYLPTPCLIIINCIVVIDLGICAGPIWCLFPAEEDLGFLVQQYDWIVWQHIQPNGRRKKYKLIKTPPFHTLLIFLATRGFDGYNCHCWWPKPKCDLVARCLKVYSLQCVTQTGKKNKNKKHTFTKRHHWSSMLSVSILFRSYH